MCGAYVEYARADAQPPTATTGGETMSVASQVLRIIIFPIILITVGTIAVFGFIVIEPFFTALGEPAAGLNWGTPALQTLTFASFGFLGLILTLIIWFIYAPIREDRRQQYRY